MAQPWYAYNRIDNFGMIDPAGPYYKPDSNIQIPGYYPVTALLSGTVTSVQRTSWGQTVVTVKLDRPLNSLATHTFYEHLSSSNVSIGQHLKEGDLLGYNNPPGQVPLGFGLYSGDVYGSGSAWATLQSDLRPGGAGLLNPVSLLNAARSGKPIVGSDGTSTVSSPTLSGSAFFAQVGQKIGLFLLAMVLIVTGMYITFTKQVNHFVSGTAKTAGKVAMVA